MFENSLPEVLFFRHGDVTKEANKHFFAFLFGLPLNFSDLAQMQKHPNT